MNNITAKLKTELTKQRENLQRQLTGIQKSLDKIDNKLELLTDLETRSQKPAKPVSRAKSPDKSPATSTKQK